jgi:hypothetical protein
MFGSTPSRRISQCQVCARFGQRLARARLHLVEGGRTRVGRMAGPWFRGLQGTRRRDARPANPISPRSRSGLAGTSRGSRGCRRGRGRSRSWGMFVLRHLLSAGPAGMPDDVPSPRRGEVAAAPDVPHYGVFELFELRPTFPRRLLQWRHKALMRSWRGMAGALPQLLVFGNVPHYDPFFSSERLCVWSLPPVWLIRIQSEPQANTNLYPRNLRNSCHTSRRISGLLARS